MGWTRRGIRVVAVMAGAVVSCSSAAWPAAAEGSGDQSFRFDTAGCHEVQVGVPVSTAAVREDVPARFTPAETVPGSGVTTLAIGVRRCTSTTVEGGTAAVDRSVAEVGVTINPPEGGVGQHFYQLWSLSNDRKLARRMRQIGMEGGYVRDLTLAVSVLGGHVAAPWQASPYRYMVVAPGGDGVDFPSTTFTWWHDGSRGEIRSTYTFPPEKVRPGSGIVSAAPGSRLARLLGGTHVVGIGAVIALPGYSAMIERTGTTDG